MKETKNNKGSKGTKGTKQKTTKPVVEKEAMMKLMNGTMRKLSVLAKDIKTVPRKKTTGWKLGSKVIVAMGSRKSSFKFWLYQFSEKTGARKTIEEFEIKTTGKDSEKVVESLIAQVKKNYDILKAIQAKREKSIKAEPKKKEAKKESFKDAKIIEEIPIEEALKETKKEVAVSA